MESSSALNWKTEVRQMADLTPLDKNPFGKITQENKRRLSEKLKRLGNFDVATIDQNGMLLTFNKRFHLLRELGYTEIDVKVPQPSADRRRTKGNHHQLERSRRRVGP